MRLIFETPCGTFTIACDRQRAPRTLAAVAALAPMTARLQSPKIAGSHIYWQTPIVERVEGAADVMSAPPGSFLYWPERQFLELIYAPLQSESATVSVLGCIEGDIAPLERLGRQVRERHGEAPVEGVLRLDGAAPRTEEAPAPAGLSAVRRARNDVWSTCPAEITALMTGRGLMHPAGPLFVAESEARNLHETLWWLRQRLLEGEQASGIAVAAQTACRKAAARLGGFCHLPEAAATIGALADAIRGCDDAGAVLKEGILYAGGLSAWLDLQIPWNAVNETVRRVHDARS